MSTRTFPGTVLAVHDGDTLTVALDLGFALTQRADIRLAGINAAELAAPGGPEAGAHLLGLAPPSTACTVTVLGLDKFGGRVDARVTVGGFDLSMRMISDGYAVAWNGRGPKPVPPWPIPVAVAR